MSDMSRSNSCNTSLNTIRRTSIVEIKGRRLLDVLFWILLFNNFQCTDSCSFPEDLRGSWISSKKGQVQFTTTTLINFYPCRSVEDCGDVASNWTCTESSGHKYVIMSDDISISSIIGRIFSCLYLLKVSNTKYLMYQGPKEEKGKPYFDYVQVALKPTQLGMQQLCDLDDAALPPARHNLLIKDGTIDTAKTTCPTDILGHYREVSYNVRLDVCTDRKQLSWGPSDQLGNVSLAEENETMLCLDSQSAGDITYLTVYRKGPFAEMNDSNSFICIAIVLNGTEVYISQKPRDCRGLDTPPFNTTFVFETQDLCPIECSFSPSLIGSWVSNRKGELVVTNDTIQGFVPFGPNCDAMDCFQLPTEFKCFLKDGSKYLIRSLKSKLGSNYVRIYVCIDTVMVTRRKIVYYQAHGEKDPLLNDYLTYLNAAKSVDSIEDICQFKSTYDAALHSILLPKDRLSDATENCPDVFNAIHKVFKSDCQFQMTTCHHKDTIKLSNVECESRPLYTSSGRLGCIYNLNSGPDNYLTLLNKDNSVENNSTYLFTCVAYQIVSRTTWLIVESPMACYSGQMDDMSREPYNATQKDSCPVTDGTTWLIILIVLVVILLVILCVFLIVWYFCGGKRHCQGLRDKHGVGELSLGNDVEKDACASRKPSHFPIRFHENWAFGDVFTSEKHRQAEGHLDVQRRGGRKRGNSLQGEGQDVDGVWYTDGRATNLCQPTEEEDGRDFKDVKEDNMLSDGTEDVLGRDTTLVSRKAEHMSEISDGGFLEDGDTFVDSSSASMKGTKRAKTLRDQKIKDPVTTDGVHGEAYPEPLGDEFSGLHGGKRQRFSHIPRAGVDGRRHRKYGDRVVLTSISGQNMRSRAASRHKMATTNQTGNDLENTPYYSQYNQYVTTRSKLIKEGFWSDRKDSSGLPEEFTTFSQIGDLTRSSLDIQKYKDDYTKPAVIKGIDVSSLPPMPPISPSVGDSDKEMSTNSSIEHCGTRPKHLQGSTPLGIDLLDELCAKLHSLEDDKDEDLVYEDIELETTLKRDRRHISSAFLKLLTERLNVGLLESQESQTGELNRSTLLYQREDLLTKQNGSIFRSYQRHPVSSVKTSSRKEARDSTWTPTHGRSPQTKNKSNVKSTNPNNASLSWTYNVPSNSHDATSDQSTSDEMDFRRALSLRSINDLNLRKLLEELYKEYLFMGKVIRTSAETDTTELEVRDKLQKGRQYLLKRALFWLERSTQATAAERSVCAAKIHRQQQDTMASVRKISPQDKESSSEPEIDSTKTIK